MERVYERKVIVKGEGHDEKMFYKIVGRNFNSKHALHRDGDNYCCRRNGSFGGE